MKTTSKRPGKLAKFFFSALCEENAHLFGGASTEGDSWRQRVEDELYTRIGNYEPVTWAFRVYTHEFTTEELLDNERNDEDDCDYEVEHDGEFCESCAEKKLAERRAEDPSNKHTIIGNHSGCTEADGFPRCESCDVLFGYSYIISGQELKHWSDNDVTFDSPEEMWEAYEVLRYNDYDKDLTDLRYTAFQNIAKGLFKLLRR